MIVFPAMDLIAGQCVRLVEGDFDQKTIYKIDPVDNARNIKSRGANWLHIVDLDGAKLGKPQQHDLIIEVAQKTSLKVQCGGGIHSVEAVENLLNSGVERVVIGSLAVKNSDLALKMLDQFGPEKIVIALDIKLIDGVPYPAMSGWQEIHDKSLWDILSYYSTKIGHSNSENDLYFLITDIGTDGKLSGPNFDLYKEIQQRHVDLNLIASGGVSKVEDLEKLQQAAHYGVIVGKALYEKKIALEALWPVFD